MRGAKRAAGKTEDSAPSTPRLSQRVITTGAATPSTPNRSPPLKGKGPKAGTFEIDPTRATMTSDDRGKKIKMLPPSQPLEKEKQFWDRARSANSSQRGSPRGSYMTMPNPGADSFPAQPFTAQSTLGSMFNGNLDILHNNDAAGFASKMVLPPMTGPPRSSFTATTATEPSDIGFEDINMQDFVDIDDSETEDDAAPPGTLPPMLPSTSGSFTSDNGNNDSQQADLLGHFDQCVGAVGSFRRNQNQAKHISSLASHPAKRASTHEYNALQKGRRGAANTPMTPARKKRASQDFSSTAGGIRKSMNSPLTSRRPRSRGNSLAGIANADLYQTLARSPFD